MLPTMTLQLMEQLLISSRSAIFQLSPTNITKGANFYKKKSWKCPNIFILTVTNLQDTICTADVVQVGLGSDNGDFNFNTFLFNEADEDLDIVCQLQLCLKTENCFEQYNDDCEDYYTKQQ